MQLLSEQSHITLEKPFKDTDIFDRPQSLRFNSFMTPWYLGQVRQSSVFSCSSCWKTAQVFSYHCLHARCTTLAAYLSADTIIVLLRWSPGVSFTAPLLTFVTSAAQCWFWHHFGRC